MSNDSIPDSASDDLRQKPGDPNDDRGYLADQPPTQVDEDTVIANAETADAEVSTDADAARD